jgi:hypothetical protein
MIDFNDAEPQIEFGLIPANTVAKARFVLKPGHYFSDPILTGSKSGDSVYLDYEFVILEGPHAKRKVFDKIGISGSDTWVNAGKSKIRAILESGKNVSPKDTSPAAAFARSIKSYEASMSSSKSASKAIAAELIPTKTGFCQ